MFKLLVKEGVDYEVFSAEKLPDVMRDTGGIQYIPGNLIPVQISDNVPEEFRSIWVKHEIACNTGTQSGLAHHCREVSEEEIRRLVPESLLTEYIKHRVAMLRAAVEVNRSSLENLNYANYFLNNPDKKTSTELAIAKLSASLDFFHREFASVLSK